VEAGILDEPSVQGKTLEWDLWASTGPKTTARQRFRSVQGSTAEFTFDALTIPGGENDERVLFAGKVTGRVRLDGNIEAAVEVRPSRGQRMSQAELIALQNSGRQRYGDRTALQKPFTAKPGEAVKIVVPMSVRRTTTNPATGRATTTSAPAPYESS